MPKRSAMHLITSKLMLEPRRRKLSIAPEVASSVSRVLIRAWLPQWRSSCPIVSCFRAVMPLISFPSAQPSISKVLPKSLKPTTCAHTVERPGKNLKDINQVEGIGKKCLNCDPRHIVTKFSRATPPWSDLSSAAQGVRSRLGAWLQFTKQQPSASRGSRRAARRVRRMAGSWLLFNESMDPMNGTQRNTLRDKERRVYNGI